ncbi:MAG: nitrogenase component 1 [Chloroflexi bacterium]|nr:nitrogenase component 1 [Chloroflexota bacterium]
MRTVKSTAMAEPQGPCMVHGAQYAIDAIKLALILLHSPPGCQTLPIAVSAMSVGKGLQMRNSLLVDNDVIFGAQEKLKKYIAQADHMYHPSLIAVLNSCASQTIGEDIEDVVEFMRPEVEAKLIAVPTCGYEGKVIDGYNMTFEKLVNDIMEEPEQKAENQVNVVGWFRDDAHFEEAKRLLGELGLKVGTGLTAGSTLEGLQKAPQAALNVILAEPSALVCCQLMEDRFGVPYAGADEMTPYGFEATAAWLRAVARAVGAEAKAEEVIAKEWAEAKAALEALNGDFKGKRVLIEGGAELAVGMTNFACELGMEPVAVGISSGASEKSLELLEKIVQEKGIDPTVYPDINLTDVQNELLKSSVDLVLGGTSWVLAYYAERYNATLVPVAYPMAPIRPPGSGSYLGFKGIPVLAKDIQVGLEKKGKLMVEQFEKRIRSKTRT